MGEVVRVDTETGEIQAPATPQRRVSVYGVFEGKEIDAAIIKVKGSAEVGAGDGVLPRVTINDVLRLVGEFRVASVAHEIDKDGNLVRVTTIVATSALELTPWDPEDEADDGIVRQHPEIISGGGK